MTRFILLALCAAALFPPSTTSAQVPQTMPRVGDEFEIIRRYETSQQSDDGESSGSSRGRTTILERVVAVRDGGLELIYDLPRNTSKADRAREWQLPARVFRPPSGPVQLLNAPQLEARLERWLKTAKWTRAMCGRTIFTWNAFRIECDPQAVLETIAAYDLRMVDIREGTPYREKEALAVAPLIRKDGGQEGQSLSATMEIDPTIVQRLRAETDVAVAEIMQKPTTLEAALRERANEGISGTIITSFDLNAQNDIVRRTTSTTMRTAPSNGRSESETSKVITERRRVSPVTPAAATPQSR